MALPRLIGMIHLAALPGAPGYQGDMRRVRDAAVRDAQTLADAGFDGLMVENFGDAPFFPDDVPQETVAAVSVAVAAVVDAVAIPVGVNVLRNDAHAALAVAAATGASYIRVNVLSGTMFTDQGMIHGRAAEVARMRSRLCPDVAILADVFVKHASPPPGSTIESAANDLATRGGADAVIVSGTGTGVPADPDRVRRVAALTGLPVFVGSGVDAASVGGLLADAYGVIVGTSLKRGRAIENPIDPELAVDLVAAAR